MSLYLEWTGEVVVAELLAWGPARTAREGTRTGADAPRLGDEDAFTVPSSTLAIPVTGDASADDDATTMAVGEGGTVG